MGFDISSSLFLESRKGSTEAEVEQGLTSY